jgi:hypothetical protein
MRAFGGDDRRADNDERCGDLVELPLEVSVSLVRCEERFLGVLEVKDARHVFLSRHQLEQRLTIGRW